VRSRLRAGLVAAGAAAALAGAAAPALATTATVTRDGVTASLTYSGSVVRNPGPITLTLTRAGVTQTFTGLESDPAAGGVPHGGVATYEAFTRTPLRLRDLDGDGEPEALVRLFSGGAHCCEVLSVASYDPAAAAYRLTALRLGDASWVLRDLGGTPSPEFVSWDARWAYWGGVYAGSPQPLRIWSFSAGAFTDATRRFPAALRRDQARQWAWSARARRQGGDYTGALAAYVADGYSLGRPGPALARVRAALPAKGRARFLKALHNNLVRLGYTS
jgi:hypothetical protein